MKTNRVGLLVLTLVIGLGLVGLFTVMKPQEVQAQTIIIGAHIEGPDSALVGTYRVFTGVLESPNPFPLTACYWEVFHEGEFVYHEEIPPFNYTTQFIGSFPWSGSYTLTFYCPDMITGPVTETVETKEVELAMKVVPEVVHEGDLVLASAAYTIPVGVGYVAVAQQYTATLSGGEEVQGYFMGADILGEQVVTYTLVLTPTELPAWNTQLTYTVAETFNVLPRSLEIDFGVEVATVATLPDRPITYTVWVTGQLPMIGTVQIPLSEPVEVGFLTYWDTSIALGSVITAPEGMTVGPNSISTTLMYTSDMELSFVFQSSRIPTSPMTQTLGVVQIFPPTTDPNSTNNGASAIVVFTEMEVEKPWAVYLPLVIRN